MMKLRKSSVPRSFLLCEQFK